MLAIVFLAGNVGAFLHAAVERHARCPEHGHLIHVKGDATQLPAAEPSATGNDDVVIQPADTAADGHDHEHCHICQISRKRALPGQGMSQLRVPATELRQHHVDIVVLRADLSRYVIAPKTSPPV